MILFHFKLTDLADQQTILIIKTNSFDHFTIGLDSFERL